MTDRDDDERVSRRYRELPAEEPPRALDEAILAAARREVRVRPAPLVAPTGRRRWYVPVAAAAVIVLAVALTLRVQLEQPAPDGQVLREDKAPPAASPAPERRARSRAESAPPAEVAKSFVPDPGAPAAPAAQAELASRDRAERSVAGAASARLMQREAAPTPERELERIAELRKNGRHDEADKALAEFRKRYPDYKIPEKTRERVERR